MALGCGAPRWEVQPVACGAETMLTVLAVNSCRIPAMGMSGIYQPPSLSQGSAQAQPLPPKSLRGPSVGELHRGLLQIAALKAQTKHSLHSNGQYSWAGTRQTLSETSQTGWKRVLLSTVHWHLCRVGNLLLLYSKLLSYITDTSTAETLFLSYKTIFHFFL